MINVEERLKDLRDVIRRNKIKACGLISEAGKYILADDIEIVLNMLKEKDKEIEHWKNGFERELEDNRKNTCELLKQDLIIREKDKQIDLMANSILTRDIGKNRCQFNETCTKFEKGRDIHCKDCIKQYFEKLAERKSEEC